jgi:hypothetical protein
MAIGALNSRDRSSSWMSLMVGKFFKFFALANLNKKVIFQACRDK